MAETKTTRKTRISKENLLDAIGLASIVYRNRNVQNINPEMKVGVIEIARALQSRTITKNITNPSLSSIFKIRDWHEDYSCCLFWKLPICEPPYVGSMLDDKFPKRYYTHFQIINCPSDRPKVEEPVV